MMNVDELQSPGSKRPTDPLPSQRRRLTTKKTKILGDFAGTCALSQNSSFDNSSSSIVSIPSGGNAKAGPSTKADTRRDIITPIRVSSRVSRPTLKKKASSFQRRSRSLESDGTPPLTASIPSGGNAKPGPSPSTKLNAVSQRRDIITPTRVSFRVSRPTLKRKSSSFERRSRSLESDGTPLITSIPSGRNVKADPSAKSNPASQRRDITTPIRVSSRVSRPTLKKKASSFKRKSRSLESDGTPPLSIISPAPPPSLKRKRPTNTPIKGLTGNNTPYKTNWLDPNPIELTSDDDGNRAQPPQKRVKHTPRKVSSSQVIDLCSEGEDVISLPKRRRTRDKGSVVVVLSTDDEEVDPGPPSFSRLTLNETDTRESPAWQPSGNVSPPIEDGSVFRASPLPQTHSIPIPIPNVPAAEEDGTIDESNTYTDKVAFPRGSLQTLYNEALARCAREPQHAKEIIDQPSPFSSLKCMPPTRTIRHSTQNQSPTLHTPLFFNRVIRRLRARLKLRKILDAKSFPGDANFVAMEISKLNEEQEDTSDTVMEYSAVDTKAPVVATKMITVPPVDFQNDALSDTQEARISPSILADDLDVNEKHVSETPEFPSPLANQESSLPLGVVIPEDTSIPESSQAQEASANSRTATPEMNSSTNSSNMLCGAPLNLTNPNAFNYQIESLQEAETILFRRENCVNQVATLEPSALKAAQFLVQALRRRYDAPKISEPSLLSAMKSNDTAKPSAAPESLSKSPVRSIEKAATTNASCLTISSSEDTSSGLKYLSESPMMLTDHVMIQNISLLAASGTGSALSTSKSSESPMIILMEQPATSNLSSLACSSGEDALSSAEYLFKLPAMLTEHATTPAPASSSGAGMLSSGDSPPSNQSRQSSDHSNSTGPVDCRLVTPEDSPSPLTPPVKAQEQEPLIRSSSSPPIVASFFDMDLSELGLRTLMGNSKFDEDDDDDISISGMELVYPEEII